MMATLTSWFWEMLKLALVALGTFYAVYVLVTYSNVGPNYRVKLDRADPVHSLERILVWLGINITALVLALGKMTFNYLSEPSAEVGDWVLDKSPRLQRLVVRQRPR